MAAPSNTDGPGSNTVEDALLNLGHGQAGSAEAPNLHDYESEEGSGGVVYGPAAQPTVS